MFSLLSPISLWFGALLAVPLVIHFLGRQRLDREPFPSLLLVREGFSRSMRRHRLKNLLLLVIRTLLIACLLLALSNPALESRRATAKPDQSLALIHNGIYGKLPAPAARSEGGAAEAAAGARDILSFQRARLRALDSAQGIRTRTLRVIEDGPGAAEISERFGDYPAAVRRLLAALESGTSLANLPVFSWTEFARCRPDLLRALEEHPGVQMALTDFSGTTPALAAFADPRTLPAADAPTVRLSARLAAAAAESRIQVWLDGRLFQESAPSGGRVEATLPLGSSPRTEGRLALADASVSGRFAAPELFFCFPEGGAWALAHSGSPLLSLPSLGRETYFRRVSHVGSAADIPWDGLKPTSGGDAPIPLRLAYLAPEPSAPPEAYARAIEFVKRGGRLVIAAGRQSDVPALNRFLLQPLRMGRLGDLADSGGPVSVARDALAREGWASALAAAAGGSLGAVRKRFAFVPDSGAVVLLSQRGSAVLAERDFHRGKALLWTTDPDDLEWTDLGVSPLMPLLHQAFQEGAADGSAADLTVASDSIYALPAAAGEETASSVEIRDPEGRPFTKARTVAGRLRIGPFDRLGLHRVIRGGDTSAFAVNLFPAGNRKAPPAAEERIRAEARAREDFLAAVKPYEGRISLLAPEEPLAAKASLRRLWPAFLAGAILLLLLEGLIAARFAARRSAP